jgi:anaerobic carbon-monoxide dehydrogenase iron sulfur subunit
MARILEVDPTLCDGCRLCESACSVVNAGVVDPGKSRIRVIPGFGGLEIPVFCRHCTSPPCRDACPRDAVYIDEAQGLVKIDPFRCVGCGMCVAACPFRALGFDTGKGRPFKCDVCGGEPACIHVCDSDAIAYVEDYNLCDRRVREAASLISRNRAW